MNVKNRPIDLGQETKVMISASGNETPLLFGEALIGVLDSIA
jgi:hypothetical protein